MCRLGALAIFLQMFLAAGVRAQSASEEVSGKLAFNLKIGIVADGAEPSLRFTATNLSHGDIDSPTEPGQRNPLVMLAPNGSVNEYWSHGFPSVAPGSTFAPATRPRPLHAGEAIAWTVAINTLRIRTGLRDAGEYRLYWDEGGCRSNEIAFTCRRWPGHVEDDDFASALTPHGSLWHLCRTMDGDPLMIFGDDRPNQLLPCEVCEAIRHRSFASLDLRASLEHRFGANVAQFWGWEAIPIVKQQIKRAHVAYSKYFFEAVIHLDPPIKLIRKDSRDWMVAASSLLERDKFISDLESGTDLLKKISDDIARGRFNTPLDAATRLSAAFDNAGCLLVPAAKKCDVPATMPSTTPAGG